MVKTSWLPALAAVLISTAGCGASVSQQKPKSTPAPAPTPQVQAPPAAAPAPDPVALLIEAADRHFKTGQQELQQGHLDRARAEFDRALEVLIESPYGGRSEPRIREHFDRLVDRISGYEVAALAEGDGFAEKASEPASIDELLALTTTIEKPAPTRAVEEAVQSDLAAHPHDIPIPLNDRVLGYVELFQGRLRNYIQDGISRGSQYLPMIQSVFRAEGLPLDLAYVPLIESAFKPNALSRAKARGVWQFMRGTAVENGLTQDWYVDERSDPEKATRAAAKYLKTLRGMFDGDWHLALASYNGGPGRVQRAMRRTGISDFWQLTNGTKILPRETREYVPMILAAIVIARNPAQYGFDLPDVPQLSYERVRLPGPLDLRRVAEWTGSDIDAIQQLNPELRRWTTPIRSSSYELKVPVGTAGLLTNRLAASAGAERTALNWHTVKRGESLATIARKLGVNRADLAEANYLSVRSRVSTGQKLVIPRPPSALLASRPDRPVPLTESRAVVSADKMTTQPPTAEQSARVKLTYRVKRGDTLSSIARLYRTTVASIQSWNKMRGSRIAPGDRLTIFTNRREL
jgi:membrane-bound lytic murein transglycosylase D